MRGRRDVGLAGLALLMGLSVPACSDDYVGSSEQVTVVVHDQPPCNVSLVVDDERRHGLDWYSKSTAWPSRALPGEYEGTLTYESADVAIFEGAGITARFRGKESDAFVTADCPITPLWNPDGSGRPPVGWTPR